MDEHRSGMKLLRVNEVAARTGYNRIYIYRLERNGEFPRRIVVGPNRVAWLEHEIDAWIMAKAAARGSEDQLTEGAQRNREHLAKARAKASKPWSKKKAAKERRSTTAGNATSTAEPAVRLAAKGRD